MTTCFFAFIGFETIALTASENKHLEKYETIKMGSKKLTLRISILYILCTFVGGLTVPYNDPMLADIQLSNTLGAQNSIFVLAAVRHGLTGWPSFFTGFFIFSGTTSAINAVYNSSRLLHALASIPEAWPLSLQHFRRRLERTTSRGVPLATVVMSWCVGLLAFLGLKPFPFVVHKRITTNVTVSTLICYATICLAFTRFYKRIAKAAEDPLQENRTAYDRENKQYPYRTCGQLMRAYYGFAFCILLILFSGWKSFVTPFNQAEFIASYLGVSPPTFHSYVRSSGLDSYLLFPHRGVSC